MSKTKGEVEKREEEWVQRKGVKWNINGHTGNIQLSFSFFLSYHKIYAKHNPAVLPINV